MNLTDSMILKFLKGSPVFLEDICAIYPATLGEIIDLGYDKFLQYLSVLTSQKPADTHKDNELKDLLAQLSDFWYLLLLMASDNYINELVKGAFRFFTKSQANFILEPPQIILGPVDEQHILDEQHFYEFQAILKKMYFLDTDGDDIIILEDDLPQVKALKMKMRADLEKVRRAKAAKAANDKSDLKMSDLIGSMAINNLGLNIINIMDITYYAFHDQLKRMGWRDQFNINQSAALAGAKINKSELKHWMRSIASDDK